LARKLEEVQSRHEVSLERQENEQVKYTTFTVFIRRLAYKDEHRPQYQTFNGGDRAPVFEKHLAAQSREGALEKCLPDIVKELPKLRGRSEGVWYVQVYVGDWRASKEKPAPFLVSTKTGKVYNKGVERG